MKYSKQIQEKIDQKSSIRRMTSEHKKKISMSKSGKNHPNWGKTTSEITKEKIREANILAKQRDYLLEDEVRKYHLTSKTLHSFCKALHISWNCIMKTKNTGVPYKGWLLKEIK